MLLLMDELIKKLFSNIPDRAYAREGRCVCEGRIVIEKALQNGIRLEALLCTRERLAEYKSLCHAYTSHSGTPTAQIRVPNAPSHNFPIVGLSHREIEQLVGFDFHRGALAIAQRPPLMQPKAPVQPVSSNTDSTYRAIFTVHSESVPSHTPSYTGYKPGSTDYAPDGLMEGNALILWQVTDPDNLGALIRCASALGARAVILSPGSADPYSRKALRTSMGCAFSMQLYAVQTIDELVAFSAAANASLTAACPIHDKAIETTANTKSEAVSIRRQTKLKAKRIFTDGVSPAYIEPDTIPRPLWLMLGNEGWGLPEEVLSKVSYRVAIPMHNNTDSLNVAAAGAILMYELFY